MLPKVTFSIDCVRLSRKRIHFGGAEDRPEALPSLQLQNQIPTLFFFFWIMNPKSLLEATILDQRRTNLSRVIGSISPHAWTSNSALKSEDTNSGACLTL
ncbi:hypothetical protein PVAP13_9KG652200 [Panicum virgatum]|uniref:Uncharacterized protein n=1 Tax=Panicum virgatum TaxID=38727 RepID=A0A8T0P0T1_PANVG|nr:hypothetical protein PVAP13_9KG652200 [Panicum virgatum]